MTPDRLFFYGTLMSRGPRGHILRGLGRFIGPAAIRGDLYAVGSGSFPAYVPGDGTIYGEVWRAHGPEHLALALQITDGIEGFEPRHPERSMYVRETVPLLDGRGDVQTYRWALGEAGLRRIPSGSWREFALRGGGVMSEGVEKAVGVREP